MAHRRRRLRAMMMQACVLALQQHTSTVVAYDFNSWCGTGTENLLRWFNVSELLLMPLEAASVDHHASLLVLARRAARSAFFLRDGHMKS